MRSVVIPFINKYFNATSLLDYNDKYMKLNHTHGEIADHVEALLVSYESGQFPIDTDNSAFFVYKLNRPDPELEMIEVYFGSFETDVYSTAHLWELNCVKEIL